MTLCDIFREPTRRASWLTMFVVLGLNVLLRAAEPATGPSLQPATRPLPTWPQAAAPDASALAEADAIVRRVFQGAFENKDSDARQALAKRLLAQGIVLENDAAVRFVVLKSARDLASDSGDAHTAMKAIDRLVKHFGLAELEVREMALTALATSATRAGTPEAKGIAADLFLQLMEAARAVGDVDLAQRAGDIASPLAEQTKHALLQAAIRREKESPDPSLTAGRVAVEHVLAGKTDAGEGDTAGRFLCLRRGDWVIGLPLLAAGSDTTLASLAKRDLEARAPADLADAWWQAADAHQDADRYAMRVRAAHWMHLAIPQIADDAARQRMIDRMAEVRRDAQSPGLLTDIWAGEFFDERRGTRVDSNVNFDWKSGAPDSRVAADHFSMNWTGDIRAPAGKYDIEADADDGMVVVLGGKKVIDEWRGHKGLLYGAADLPLAAAHINIAMFENAGMAAARVRWKPPGKPAFDPIPPSAFWHDAIWPWDRVALVTGWREIDSTACSTATAATQPVEAKQVFYKRFATPCTFHAARRECERLGGHLAYMVGEAQRDCLLKVGGKMACWLGGTDEPFENHWEWLNGVTILSEQSEWLEREPSGSRAENFLSLSEKHGWNDSNGRQAFICQWDR